MKHLCPACQFCNIPLPGRLVGAASGTGLSPGQLEAARELMQFETERRNDENRRVENNYKFDYEPQFFPWCSAFTPSKEQIAEATRQLMLGDTTKLLELEATGLDVIIDAPNGKVKPVYALCARKNPNGECGLFQTREVASDL
ncbi:MAG TPA: hypothetical protein DCE44_18515 [Verrucomicrobiales bacterium]|nr:hypothetical protein [Verrucomicrobiales bacterium]